MESGRVLAPFGRRSAAVLAREQYGPYVVLGCLDTEGPLPAPGQFYMLAAARRWGGGSGERPFLPRAFSALSAQPQPRRQGVELGFMLEDVGPGTNRLSELQAGDELLLLGPLGQGFRAPREQRRPVLIAGGVGIAPIAIWRDALGKEVTTLLGFRDRLHAQGARLLPGAQVATDDGSSGHHGLVTELLVQELDKQPHSEVYACGPPPMLEAVRRICSERGVSGQLALESGMACGFGACFGCVVPTRDGLMRLCVEGPVLELDALSVEAAGAHNFRAGVDG